jgi:hypothetical protein
MKFKTFACIPSPEKSRSIFFGKPLFVKQKRLRLGVCGESFFANLASERRAARERAELSSQILQVAKLVLIKTEMA